MVFCRLLGSINPEAAAGNILPCEQGEGKEEKGEKGKEKKKGSISMAAAL